MSMRARLVAVVVVALLLSGSATAYAAWSRSATVAPTAGITSGGFDVKAAWVKPVPTGALWPGESQWGVASITHSGSGRWQHMLATATATPALPGLTVTYTTSTGADNCSATSLPAEAWSATQPNGSTVYVCVTATLAATASSAAQGVSSAFTVVVTGRNQSTS